MKKGIKIGLWIVLLLGLGLSIIIYGNQTAAIFFILLLLMAAATYIASVVNKRNSPKMFGEKLLEDLKKKERNLNENLRLISAPVKYGDTERLMSKLEPAYFISGEEPRRRIKKIKENMDEINSINKNLLDGILKISEMNRKEEIALRYSLMHHDVPGNVLISSEITLQDAAINERLSDKLSEQERQLIKKLKAPIEKIKEAKHKLEESLQNEKIRKDLCSGMADAFFTDKKYKIVDKLKDVLEKIKSEYGRNHELIEDERIADLLRDIEGKNDTETVFAAMNVFFGIVASFNKEFTSQKTKVQELLSSALDEREKIQNILAELKEESVSVSKGNLLLLESRIPYEIPTKKGDIEVITIRNLINILKSSDFDERAFTRREIQNIIDFVEGVGGKHLADKIKENVLDTGKTGLQQLLKTLNTYFKRD